jgi:hypothetical protein
VSITATIYNVGQVDAGTFTVRFLVDGTALPDQSVVTLGKGANIVREATWKAKAGSHTIKVVIDPAGSVSEAGKANNEASITLSVPKKSAPAAEFPWLMIAVVLIVVVVAVGAVVMLMRRKKPATVIQYQPPAAPPSPPMTQAPVSPPPPPPPTLSTQNPQMLQSSLQQMQSTSPSLQPPVQPVPPAQPQAPPPIPPPS